jgi:peptide/nickel transport system substrate-binding protein
VNDSSQGVVTFAELPGDSPNYISPMESGAYITDANGGQFAHLMYLPLYWFGDRGKPVLNPSLSIGEPPIFSDNNTVVTVTMKHWVWSDGRPITARDVIFWMNLLSTVTDPTTPAIGSSSAPGPGWGLAYSGGFPENVVSYQQTGTYSVVFHLNGSYSPTWFLDDNLNQIYPLPTASWDKLSLGSSVGNSDTSAESRIPLASTSSAPCDKCYVPADPGTANRGPLAVAQFINEQSQDLSTYATNTLWKVVDGPFRLTQFSTNGFVKMVPNHKYSGSPKPKIKALEELPFTTDSAEYDALTEGTLTIGYIPEQDLGQRTALEKRQSYKFAPWYSFGIDSVPYNLTSPAVGPIFKQLYFRQAFQSLINQPQYIKDFYDGIGSVDNGPLPPYPLHSPYASRLETSGQLYPYNPSHAVQLLQSHGWKINPGGVSVCVDSGTAKGDCGAGIPANQPLTFSMLYENGSTQLTNEMQAMQSTVKAKAGITLSLSQGSENEVVGLTFDTICTFAAPCKDWQITDWATTDTWTFEGGLASGEEIFTPFGINAGDYTSATNLANITATQTAPNEKEEIQSFHTYENYVVRQVPFLLLPNGPYQLTMYKSNLKGLLPQGIFTELYPQNYSLASS